MAENIFNALKKGSEIELSVMGRISGRNLPRPVWFVLSKDRKSVQLIPVSGRKTQWYLNVKRNPRVTIRVLGSSFSAEAHELPGSRFGEVLDAFRAKYGSADIKRYYPMVGIDDVSLEVPLTGPR